MQTTLPIAPLQLQPRFVEKERQEEIEENRIIKQENDFNRRHNAKDLKPTHPGGKVWITDRKAVGTVQKKAKTPISYFVKEGQQILRRSRKHLVPGGKLSVLPGRR